MKTWIVALLCVVGGSALIAQGAIAYESVTVADTAIGISSSVYTVSGKNASQCIASTETAPIRFRYDGVDPTASEGILVQPGSFLTITGFPNIKAFRAIRTGATSATLKVTCHAF